MRRITKNKKKKSIKRIKEKFVVLYQNDRGVSRIDSPFRIKLVDQTGANKRIIMEAGNYEIGFVDPRPRDPRIHSLAYAE